MAEMPINAEFLDNTVSFERYGGGAARLVPLKESTITSEDLQTIALACNTELMKRWVTHQYATGKDGAYTRADAKQFVKHSDNNWQEQNGFVFGIYNNANQLLGVIDIQSTDDNTIGYWMNPNADSRGYMTNAVLALASIAKRAGYQTLSAFVDPENEKSANVLLRAGFTDNGSKVNPKVAKPMRFFIKQLVE